MQTPAPTVDGSKPVLEVVNLVKEFSLQRSLLVRRRDRVHAVDGVSFKVEVGETLGLVGESGCGKSTLARAVMRLIEPTSGQIYIDGTDIVPLSKRQLRPYRRQLQIVFQDPFASLNPRLSAAEIVAEPLDVHDIGSAEERMERVVELFQRVGLRASQMKNFPHQFSGGQRQRIGIARALASNPRLIVADEPVSALDVSIQAQVVNLLMDIQQERKLSYLFIAHDLAVVAHISHKIAVMYLGRIVEFAERRALFTQPLHPYTEALLAAVPVPNPALKREREVLGGELPSPINPPSGCHFRDRCPHAFDRCQSESPALREIGSGHLVACHLH
ncbi:peptide ABC transporter substrate-binding protein [Caballeronia mineralivorans PML1(12)]|uniref:Peptide ABC transporter substrate-binding protein n=1 Tax=Caballeronia mineralivorans PML1(12) TaxID=908627 RepID=A0A0J1D370_9BURK|nr:dipeptide ABC transporter ATP-binding protein [Caballeronia mineralivorans]KLU27169.1 peptide ABC transporter substrate-binding protein [Caballeronia mineralivorans PML1(12)]